jgi:hypothetical protein
MENETIELTEEEKEAILEARAKEADALVAQYSRLMRDACHLILRNPQLAARLRMMGASFPDPLEVEEQLQKHYSFIH